MGVIYCFWLLCHHCYSPHWDCRTKLFGQVNFRHHVWSEKSVLSWEKPIILPIFCEIIMHLHKNVAHLKILKATGKVHCSTISHKFCRYLRNIYAKCIYAKQNQASKKYQLWEKSLFQIFLNISNFWLNNSLIMGRGKHLKNIICKECLYFDS